MNLKITRTMQTGVMFFEIADEEQYDDIESSMIEEFSEQPFSDFVSFNVDDGEFFQYWLSADIVDEDHFNDACQWVLSRMEEHGATLESVS